MNEIKILKINSLQEINNELKNIEVSSSAIELMNLKAFSLPIKVFNVKLYLANILKQEMLALGGDTAIHKNVISGKVELSDLIILGNINQIQKLIMKLEKQGTSARELAKSINEKITNYFRNDFVIKTKKNVFDCSKKTLLMGVLNITPDSFYDGGKYQDKNSSQKRVKEIVDEGADIIDVGGESTRPGAEQITEKEEIERVIPVIKMIKENFDIAISIDTYKSAVAEASLDAGADLINDVSGLRFDMNMSKVAAKFNVPIIIMHIKGTPKNMQKNPNYEDVVFEIQEYLSKSIEIALKNGISLSNIIIDPGIGFGKTFENNFTIIKKLQEFKIFGLPILIGASRKSFIGNTLGTPNPEDRLEGTLAVHSAAILNGANIIRAHDIKATKRLIGIIDKLK